METLDGTLFEIINQHLASPVLDAVLPVFREKTTWIPLYLLLLYLVWKRYGARRTLYFLLCVGAVLTLADQLAAAVIKPWVGRLRPCADATIAEQVRVLVPCGGRFSFPSNHATNHFAVATLLSLTVIHRWHWRVAVFLWASAIAFAQVYVGKHFPSDVLAGAVLGSCLAACGIYVYRRLAKNDAIT